MDPSTETFLTVLYSILIILGVSGNLTIILAFGTKKVGQVLVLCWYWYWYTMSSSRIPVQAFHFRSVSWKCYWTIGQCFFFFKNIPKGVSINFNSIWVTVPRTGKRSIIRPHLKKLTTLYNFIWLCILDFSIDLGYLGFVHLWNTLKNSLHLLNLSIIAPELGYLAKFDFFAKL